MLVMVDWLQYWVHIMHLAAVAALQHTMELMRRKKKDNRVAPAGAAPQTLHPGLLVEQEQVDTEAPEAPGQPQPMALAVGALVAWALTAEQAV